MKRRGRTKDSNPIDPGKQDPVAKPLAAGPSAVGRREFIGGISAIAVAGSAATPGAFAVPAASGTLSKVDGVLHGVLAQPLANTEMELTALARSEPTSPLPHLSLALVVGFLQPERLSEAVKNLREGESLLKKNSTDPEMEFSEAFAAALSAQLSRYTLSGDRLEVKATPEADQLEQASLAKLKDAAARDHASDGPQVVTAALFCFSQNRSSAAANYRYGVSELTRLSQQGQNRDLASFFLLYAHRRGRNYSTAVSIGEGLERQYPNSSLVKKTIGTCHFFRRDFVNAEKYYKQAAALTPGDAGVQLGLAHVAAEKGDAAGAKQFAAKARNLDYSGRLAPFIKKVEDSPTPRLGK